LSKKKSNIKPLGVLKQFYDTSTGAATGAARCGSFIVEGFGLLIASYG
jgi:hypothetical protein